MHKGSLCLIRWSKLRRAQWKTGNTVTKAQKLISKLYIITKGKWSLKNNNNNLMKSEFKTVSLWPQTVTQGEIHNIKTATQKKTQGADVMQTQISKGVHLSQHITPNHSSACRGWKGAAVCLHIKKKKEKKNRLLYHALSVKYCTSCSTPCHWH